MTDRELDAAVAEKVMGEPIPTVDPTYAETYGPNQIGCWRLGTTGYEHGDNPIWEAPYYSTDHNYVAKVREQIAELGLKEQYVMRLMCVLGILHKSRGEHFWPVLNATPRHQCEAALAAVIQRQSGKPGGAE